MVKKLLKHEFLAWMRVMPILYGIMLAVAAINRCIQLFGNDSIYYGIIFGSGIFMYVAALMAGIVAPMIFGVVRFYRNLFTGEGYLSFTLPVTPANHLWVKALTAVCFSILSVVVAVLSGVIITAGEVFSEIWKAAAYLLDMIPEKLGGHVALYCMEAAVFAVLGVFASYLLYYMYICIGQLSRKNRILAAVGAYFAVYVISQIFGTGVGLLLLILEEAGVLERVSQFVIRNPVETVHIAQCGGILINAALSAVCYLVCHRIIRKKLNLE